MLKQVLPHIHRGIDMFALKERVWAVVNGHTGVTLSQLAELAGDAEALDYAKTVGDQFIALRGQQTIDAETARRILDEVRSRR
jgi:hypothetical protein